MSWKNRFFKWLILALRPMQTRRTLSKPPSSILIVSTTGLGDTLWATPALRSLKTAYPDCTLSVLTTPLGEALLSRHKMVDELFVLEPPYLWSAFKLLNPLRRRQFDALLLFHSSQRFILPFCSLLDIPQIIGTEGLQKDLDFLLTTALPRRKEHEVARRLAQAQALGAHPLATGLEFPLLKHEEDEARRLLEARQIADHLPLVGLHPGAKNPFKQWDPDCFIEVGKRLTQHTGCQIIVSGDADEAPLVYEIASAIPGAIPLAGELSVGAFAALLKKYTVFITNDTGPMHLAFALKTPTVALFGPTDPRLCGPWHAQHVQVVSRPATCTPCLKKQCKEPFCLLQIGADEVYDKALQLFFRSAPEQEGFTKPHRASFSAV